MEYYLHDLAKRYGKLIFVAEYSEKRKEVNGIIHNIPNDWATEHSSGKQLLLAGVAYSTEKAILLNT